MTSIRSLALAAALALSPALASAQEAPAAEARTPAPNDGASIDTLIAATYAVISGPAGQKRDWDRFRALFTEGALMIPRAVGAKSLRRLTPEDYIAQSGPFLEREGFFERETARTVNQYGDVAQVFSTYEARRKESDAEPFLTGVNAFQLVFDGTRWRVASLAWQQEAPSLPIPERYRGK